jgi:hypothetical protein
MSALFNSCLRALMGRAGSCARPRLSRELGGGDEADADHGAAARTAELREGRRRLPECGDEPQSVGLRNLPLALRTAKLSTLKLGLRGLEVGEADPLLPSHLGAPPL